MATTVSNNPFDTQQQQQSSSNGIVGSAIQSGMAAAQTYTPQMREVNRQTETAAGQVESLLAKDNPLMQRARTLALQNMSQRGLVNSSMAQGAGVAAMIDRITPIAQQDAETYSNQALANQKFTNEGGMFNAAEQNKFGLQRGEQDFTAAENQAGRQFQTSERIGSQTFTSEQNKANQDFNAAQAALDRAARAAETDKSLEAQKALQTAQFNFESAQNELNRVNQKTLQESQQRFSAEQAALDRAQQVALQSAAQSFQATEAEKNRAAEIMLADKNITAQQALEKSRQEFQGQQSALDRAQQDRVLQAQQNFASAQAALDRAQQVTLADKSIAANQALQQAQQEFQRAQAELDRTLQTSLADKRITAEQAQLQNQQTFNASQAALDRQNQAALQSSQINASQAAQAAAQAFQASQNSLQIASQNSANASAFISRTIDQANTSINAIIADGNLDAAAKKTAIQNVVDSTNSSLQWAATFYKTTVPGYTAPGQAAGVLNPGAGAGGGNAATQQASVQGMRDAIMAAGGDMARGTQLGLEYAARHNLTPEQTVAMWNSAMGKNFTVADYNRIVSGSTTETGGSGTATNTGTNTSTADPTAQALAAATAPQRAYLQANPDVTDYYYRNNIGGTTGMSLGEFAQHHYQVAGFNEGRDGQGLTAPNQNTGANNQQDPVRAALAETTQPQRAYLQANPDVLNYWFNNDTGMSLGEFAQFHYERHGVNEGRAGQGLIARNMTGGGGVNDRFDQSSGP